MSDHQKSQSCKQRQQRIELEAHEAATGIKCHNDEFMNYEGKRCKQCGKPMPDAHPNAVFCSNKGRGNCKDKYHNRQPGRIEQSRKYAPKKPAEREDIATIITRAWRNNNEGWDGHKDSW